MDIDIKDLTLLKKLGFDNRNEWLLYDDSFREFFVNLAERITDDNILSETEVLQYEILKNEEAFQTGKNLECEMNKVNDMYPGIFKFVDFDVQTKENHIEKLKKIKTVYENNIVRTEELTFGLIRSTTNMSIIVSDLESQDNNLRKECFKKAKRLEHMQMDNKSIYDELRGYYSKPSNPPLFIYQMPFDQYFTKTNLLIQNLKRYLKDNFKILDSLIDLPPIEYSDEEETCLQRLETCSKSFKKFQKKFFEIEMQNVALNKLLQEDVISRVNITTFDQMKVQIQHLTTMDSIDTKKLLEDDLIKLSEDFADQKIEMVLYKNTQEKYERAAKRSQYSKYLSRLISDALCIADLLWLLHRSDLRKFKKRFNYDETLSNANKKNRKLMNFISQFIKTTDKETLLASSLGSPLSKPTTMGPSQSSIVSISNLQNYVFEMISNILFKHFDELNDHNNSVPSNSSNTSSLSTLSPTSVISLPEECLRNYEKILKSINSHCDCLAIMKHYYFQFLEFLNKSDVVKMKFNSIIFDGPTQYPTYEIFDFFKRIYIAKNNEQLIKDEVRKMTVLFNENIVQKMENDKLWRYKQLLWIWFLTQPRKIILAIDEVKKAACKIPMDHTKRIGPIQRKP